MALKPVFYLLGVKDLRLFTFEQDPRDIIFGENNPTTTSLFTFRFIGRHFLNFKSTRALYYEYHNSLRV